MVEKMTLGEFIERMKSGWGFARPGRVRAIGMGLERMAHLAGLDLDLTVEVEFKRSSSGWGTDHRYSYRWRVRGVTIPHQFDRMAIASPEDTVFGNLSLASLTVLADGFEVGYEW